MQQQRSHVKGNRCLRMWSPDLSLLPGEGTPRLTTPLVTTNMTHINPTDESIVGSTPLRGGVFFLSVMFLNSPLDQRSSCGNLLENAVAAREISLMRMPPHAAAA